nr:histidinol dehydrogenase [Nesterenkonia sp. NBAIMH1]
MTLKDLRGTAVSSLTLSPDSELLPRAGTDITGTTDAVAPILQEVRTRGTAAMMDFAERFDGVRPSALRVPAEVLAEAAAALDPQIREALETAIARTREVHSAQLPAASVITPGPDARVTNRWVPMARVGLYVPGGQAVYPSSVVMNVVPAQVAGVESLVIASPPQKDSGGWPHPTILAAAHLLGVDEVYAAGGAQAIAMLAYGARSEAGELDCPPVSFITGPGNIFVATAKRAVQGAVGIDSEAGPTEIMVLADETAPAHLIAADLISQAEHDELAAAVLVTPSESLAQRVIEHVETRAAVTKHAERVRSSLTGSQSAVLVVDDLDAAIAVANAYGAEHLEIMTGDDARVAERITEAGAIFVGPYTPVSLGDYCAGSNHILPTGGAARYSSGLNVTAFMRSQQVVHYGREGLGMVSAHVRRLADEEGLPAHGDAVDARFG